MLLYRYAYARHYRLLPFYIVDSLRTEVRIRVFVSVTKNSRILVIVAINVSNAGFVQSLRGQPGDLKLRRTWWHTRLVDLHKANPYAHGSATCIEDQIPERW